MKYNVKGSCFLAGVHPSNQRIERTVEAPTAEAAAEQAFKGYHSSIYVARAASGSDGARFTALFGSRACGSVTVSEVCS